MFVVPNRDPALLKPEEVQTLEAVIHAISAELGESVVARGIKRLDYRVYDDDQGRSVMLEFYAVGAPQIPMDEFERVLAMRFVQVLWETHELRCLPLGLAEKDRKFLPWADGPVDFVIGGERTDSQEQALPLGLSEEGKSGSGVGPNDPCPCGSGRKYKKCCMRR